MREASTRGENDDALFEERVEQHLRKIAEACGRVRTACDGSVAATLLGDDLQIGSGSRYGLSARCIAIKELFDAAEDIA